MTKTIYAMLLALALTLPCQADVLVKDLDGQLFNVSNAAYICTNILDKEVTVRYDKHWFGINCGSVEAKHATMKAIERAFTLPTDYHVVLNVVGYQKETNNEK